MNSDWGTFTHKGSEIVERKINDMVSTIADGISRQLEPGLCRALVMIGGYGRGEGGVEIRDGIEYPHNNFDFILFTTTNLDITAREQLKQQIDDAVFPLKQQFGIGVDLSVMNASDLEKASCRVIWYDMKFGHKTILGDTSFIPSQNQFQLSRIPTWDARDLMINRGALLIINDFVLENKPVDDSIRRLLIKHAVKAIIGYGDTLLFFQDRYSWSYVEKQKRMMAQQTISSSFRDLYHQAAQFRFQPDYAGFPGQELIPWLQHIQDEVRKVYIDVEKLRLNLPSLDWESYPEQAFRHSLTKDIFSWRDILKRLYQIAKNRQTPALKSMTARLGCRSGGIKGAMGVIFPVIAFQLQSETMRTLAADILKVKPSSISALRRRYLWYWLTVIDANFAHLLKQLEIAPETLQKGD